MNAISIAALIILPILVGYGVIHSVSCLIRDMRLIGRNKNGTFKAQKKEVVALNWIVDTLVVNRFS